MRKTQKSQFDDVILWMGRPLFKPYLINHIFSYKNSIRILLISLVICIFGSLWGNTRFDWKIFFSFVTILCIVSIIQILIKIISYRNTKYWITKDSVYIQTGAIKPEVASIRKDEIVHIDLTKNKVEKKQGAGTVVIDVGEVKKRELDEYKVYKNLIAIKNPEEVIRLL